MTPPELMCLSFAALTANSMQSPGIYTCEWTITCLIKPLNIVAVGGVNFLYYIGKNRVYIVEKRLKYVCFRFNVVWKYREVSDS